MATETKRAKVEPPKTTEEAVLVGYKLDADHDESWNEVGGLLGTEVREGYIVLKHPTLDLPSLFLPYKAKLTFGTPTFEEPKGIGQSMRLGLLGS